MARRHYLLSVRVDSGPEREGAAQRLKHLLGVHRGVDVLVVHGLSDTADWIMLSLFMDGYGERPRGRWQYKAGRSKDEFMDGLRQDIQPGRRVVVLLVSDAHLGHLDPSLARLGDIGMSELVVGDDGEFTVNPGRGWSMGDKSLFLADPLPRAA